MRCAVLFLAFTAAASASVLQSRKAHAVSLPSSAFPKFHTISLQDAKSGADLAPEGHNTTAAGGFANFLMAAAASPKTAAAASCSQNPGMRFEWRQYSQSDRQAYIAAVQCLISKPPSGNFPPSANRYEDFARVHQMYMPNIHGNGKFLVWHRYFLWTFEQVLRSECGFNRAMVWWDETKDAGNFGNSDMFTNNAYFGQLTGPDGNGNPQCVNTGAFAGLTAHIGPGSSNSAHCLARRLDESATAQCNTNFVNTCNSRSSYADMASCAELGPHAYGHNGIGGVMSDVSASPSDPIFYLHHTFVDHGFRLWQNMNTARVSTINGVDAQNNPLTLNTVIHVGGIRPDVTVGQILNTLNGESIAGVPFCYRYTY